MFKLKPSNYFLEHIETFKRILNGDEGLGICVYFWITSPQLPAMILGCYLADIYIINFDN